MREDGGMHLPWMDCDFEIITVFEWLLGGRSRRVGLEEAVHTGLVPDLPTAQHTGRRF